MSEAGGRSLIAALAATIERRPGRTAFRHLVDGTWRTASWAEVGDVVNAGSTALAARGLGEGAAALIVSPGGLDALEVELSILACGATVTTVSIDLDVDALTTILALTEPRLLVTDAETAARLSTHLGALDVVVLDPSDADQDGAWPGLVAAGRRLATESATKLATWASRCARAAPALRLVAAVTAGTPSLIEVTHEQLLAQGQAMMALGVVSDRDTVMLSAPLSDPIVRALATAQVMSGAVAAVPCLGDPLAASYHEIAPTVAGFASASSDLVFHELLAYRVDGHPWSERALATIATALPLLSGRAGEQLPELALLRGFFGDGLTNLVVDLHDSPLTLSLLRMLGLPVLRAGCSPVVGGLFALDDPGDRHPMSAGRPLPGTSAWVGDEGGLLVTRPGGASAWVPTGLSGSITSTGQLRVASTPTTAWAGPVYPPRSPVEVQAIEERVVLEAEVVRRRPVDTDADGADPDRAADDLNARFVRLCAPASRLFVKDLDGIRVGLVCLDGEGLLSWAQSYSVSGTDFAEIASSDDCHGFVQACIAAVNGSLAPSQRIVDFAIIDHPLSDRDTHAGRFLCHYRVLVEQLVASARPPLTVVPDLPADEESAREPGHPLKHRRGVGRAELVAPHPGS